jgi:hypothetical protein
VSTETALLGLHANAIEQPAGVLQRTLTPSVALEHELQLNLTSATELHNAKLAKSEQRNAALRREIVRLSAENAAMRLKNAALQLENAALELEIEQLQAVRRKLLLEAAEVYWTPIDLWYAAITAIALLVSAYKAGYTYSFNKVRLNWRLQVLKQFAAAVLAESAYAELLLKIMRQRCAKARVAH